MTIDKLLKATDVHTLQQKTNEVIDAVNSGGGTITVDQTYDASSSNAQSGVAINGAKFIRNTATGSNALTVGGTASGYTGGTNIGVSSQAKQNYSTAIGYNTNANGNSSTCIGRNAGTSAASAIQIGAGINSTANTLQVGFIHASTNYQLLDGTTGLIPNERLSSDIARTSSIPTVPTVLSSFTDDLGSSPTHTHSQYLTSHQDISGKADKATTLAGYGITNAYTKTEADTAISTAVAGASHLKRVIVTSLPSVAQADDNTIYMILKSPAGSAGNVYDEYFVVNGSWEKIGDTQVDLSGYVTSVNNVSPVNGNVTLSIPDAQIQSDWNQTTTTAKDYIKNKPTLATVATSGSYNDLTNKPSIPSAQVNSDWNATSGISQILNKPTLSTVATSGSYADLSNKPSIPAETTEATVSGWGFTKNAGTVTSVNNVSPVNGNVSITIPTVPTVISAFTNDSGYITSSAIANMQTTSNLVTSVSASSTDAQYPSAKLFYDTVGNIESALNTINSGS